MRFMPLKLCSVKAMADLLHGLIHDTDSGGALPAEEQKTAAPAMKLNPWYHYMSGFLKALVFGRSLH